ncbi:MAG: hypothetical protein JRN59_08275 [Nitrososphaerota archaeon]|nr:hypothetical protein [Nitrososphaerota archaeon]
MPIRRMMTRSWFATMDVMATLPKSPERDVCPGPLRSPPRRREGAGGGVRGITLSVEDMDLHLDAASIDVGTANVWGVDLHSRSASTPTMRPQSDGRAPRTGNRALLYQPVFTARRGSLPHLLACQSMKMF